MPSTTPRVYVYSFEDTSVTISHPNFGSYTAFGSGIGSIAVSYANDVTIHDVASDLAVVVSKTAKRNGSVTFEIVQSSDFNDWMRRFANYIEQAATEEFALATISISNRSTGDNYYCTGVSHRKKADNNFQSQAQNRSWEMMCASITQS